MSEVKRMPAQEFLAWCAPGEFDIDQRGGWERMLADKCSEPSFWDLVDDIPVVGFTRPMLVESFGTRARLRNGHHRYAALALLCYEGDILYIEDADGWWDETEYESYPERPDDAWSRANREAISLGLAWP